VAKLEAEAAAEGQRGLDGYCRLLKGAKDLVARCEQVAERLVGVEQGVARWGAWRALRQLGASGVCTVCAAGAQCALMNWSRSPSLCPRPCPPPPQAAQPACVRDERGRHPEDSRRCCPAQRQRCWQLLR
jgi:hypothetical protein